jgi:clan AA aspartic protease (TIGR02281 family)
MIKRLALTLALLILPDSAFAARCDLQRLAWLDAKLTPGGQLVIPATVSGKLVYLAMDSGAPFSFLSEDFVTAEGLRPRSDMYAGFQDLAGVGFSRVVKARSMEIGALKSKRSISFAIARGFEDTGMDGTFGADFLGSYDVEIDMAQRKVGLYPHNPCKGRVVYWSDQYAVVPFSGRRGETTIDVTLDGRPLNAVIDTGAPDTILSFEAAKQFGITLSASGADNARSIYTPSGRNVPAYRRVFKRLDLGGVAFQNIPVLVSKTLGSDMILGMRELRHMHLYIAYKEKNLYITATPPETLARDAFALIDLLDKAQALAAAGDTAGADAAFDRAIAFDHTVPHAYLSRGSVKLDRGDYAGAVADYTSAIAVDPTRASSVVARAIAFAKAGEVGHAVRDLDAAIGLKPNRSDYYFYRGLFRFVSGSFAEAASDFSVAVGARPFNTVAVLWLHVARLRAGMDDRNEFRAYSWLTVINLWPGQIVSLYRGDLAPEEVLAVVSQGEPAVRTAKRCLAGFHVGEYLLAQNNVAAARSSLQEAERVCDRAWPEYFGAKAELARLGR